MTGSSGSGSNEDRRPPYLNGRLCYPDIVPFAFLERLRAARGALTLTEGIDIHVNDEIQYCN